MTSVSKIILILITQKSLSYYFLIEISGSHNDIGHHSWLPSLSTDAQ